MADSELLDRIRSAPDLGALDALRVSALGKMSPDERSAEAPKIHAAREAVTEAIAARKAELEAAKLETRLATEKVDLSLPAPQRGGGRGGPPGQ